MACTLSFQLAFRIRNHCCGHLALKYLSFNATGFVGKLAVMRTNGRDMLFDTEEPLHIEPGFTTRALQHLHEALGRIVSSPEGQRTDRRVHNVASRLDGLHQRYHRYTGGRMGVNVNKRVIPALFLDPLNQVVGSLRLKEASAVPYTDRITPQLFHLLRHFYKSRDRVEWTGVVTDCALRMLSHPLDGLNAGLQVPDIVQRIEYSEHVDAVQCRSLDKSLDDGVIEAAMCD